MSDPSATQEKLVIWLVMVVEIATAVEFAVFLCFLGFVCHFYFELVL